MHLNLPNLDPSANQGQIYNFCSSQSTNNCGICLEQVQQGVFAFFKNADAVAHEGKNGKLHPFCRKCIRQWVHVSKNTACPACNEKVNPDSVQTWQEGVIRRIKAVPSEITAMPRSAKITTACLAIAAVNALVDPSTLIAGAASLATNTLSAAPVIAATGAGAAAGFAGTVLSAILISEGALASSTAVIGSQVIAGTAIGAALWMSGPAMATMVGVGILGGIALGGVAEAIYASEKEISAGMMGAAVLGGMAGLTFGPTIGTVVQGALAGTAMVGIGLIGRRTYSLVSPSNPNQIDD